MDRVRPGASPSYPEGIPAHSRWSSEAKTTGTQILSQAIPEGLQPFEAER